MIKIRIRNEQSAFPFTLSVRYTIRKCIRGAVREMGGEKCEVSVMIVDNAAIKELNAQWRNIDRATDVLSFPMGDDSPLLGDIVLSLEKAYEQANEYGHSPAREIGFLTVHSMLHLYGYDHMEEDERVEMRRMEEKILKKLGLVRSMEENK
ncbi:MAG: rRNA maturation RNase YbeY [Clostridia bacterium]|nr:rRNA maturation RNase YbeY [Clostridia bacterium]